eukprot:3173979-Rhodomonas_salina.1
MTFAEQCQRGSTKRIMEIHNKKKLSRRNEGLSGRTVAKQRRQIAVVNLNIANHGVLFSFRFAEFRRPRKTS